MSDAEELKRIAGYYAESEGIGEEVVYQEMRDLGIEI